MKRVDLTQEILNNPDTVLAFSSLDHCLSVILKYLKIDDTGLLVMQAHYATKTKDFNRLNYYKVEDLLKDIKYIEETYDINIREKLASKNEIANGEHLIISFLLFFEILDSADNIKSLRLIDIEMTLIDILYKTNRDYIKVINLSSIDEDARFKICKKYQKVMYKEVYDKLKNSLSKDKQDFLKPREMIRKFKL